MSSSSNVWMSHMDQVTKTPKNWKIIALSSNNIIAALGNNNMTRIATQFHPEVSHTDEGQLGLKYNELEEAMNNPNSPNYQKYIKIRKLNLHKMEPIPVCKIPR